MYPSNATHSKIAERTETPGIVLMDILCMANRLPEAHLVQALMKLERCQIGLAEVKSLSEEENQVLEVDDTGLLKMELDKAKLAPAIAKLHSHTKLFNVFISSLPQRDLQQAPLAEYDFPQVVTRLDEMLEFETNTSIDRWKDVCVTVTSSIKGVFPDNWKAKCVTSYDIDWVKSHLLTQSVFTDLGTDYQFLAVWLKSLTKCDFMQAKFEERYAEALAEIKNVSTDSVAFAATILAYNVLIYKFKGQDSLKRRQEVKDVKKKIKTKLGKDANIPNEVNDRLMAAISGK